MSTEALPCIVCGRALKNVWQDADNQPSDAVAFTSPGHYGSTVFDPMDGSFLEFNICDFCLVRAGEQGRVYAARTKRPVSMYGVGIIGWIEAPYAPVAWHEGLPGYDDLIEVESVAEFYSLGHGATMSPGLTEDMLTRLQAEES